MRVWSLVLAGVLWGCSSTPPSGDGGAGGGSGGGGGGSGGGAGGGSAPTLDSYCDQVNPASCAFGVRCGLYDSTAGCLEFWSRQLEDFGNDSCSTSRAAVSDGRQDFSSPGAAACLAAWGSSSSSCATTPGACAGVFVAKVTLGGSCFNDAECITGTWCDKRQGCPGLCAARRPAGTIGQSALDCAEGLYPSFRANPDGGFGVVFVCTAPGAQGQPCEAGNVLSCQGELRCNGASGTCAGPKSAGQPCGVTDAGTFSQTVNDCAPGLVCQPDAQGVAVCGPLAGLGQRCGQCKLDLRCAPAADGGLTGTCTAKGTLGDGCRISSDCARGFYCKPSGSTPLGPGTCEARLNAGDECRGDLDCKARLVCESRPATDGGFIPERRCAPGDGGLAGVCLDSTP